MDQRVATIFCVVALNIAVTLKWLTENKKSKQARTTGILFDENGSLKSLGTNNTPQYGRALANIR